MRETQVEQGVAGVVTPEMMSVAKAEGLDPEQVMLRVAEGKIVIPVNGNGRANPSGSARDCGPRSTHRSAPRPTSVTWRRRSARPEWPRPRVRTP